MASPRVVVVTDDLLYCEGLRHVLGAVLCRSAGPPAFETALLSALPEVVLLDARLERPFELCRALRRSFEGPLLMVASPDGDAWAALALEAGANGVLARRARPEELAQAVQVVCAGGVWARREVLAGVLRRTAGSQAAPPAGTLASRRLSDREREVFRHAAMGLANKELADRLAISEATVKVHLTRIFQKLGVHGRSALAAAYHGLLAPAGGRPTLDS